MDLSDWNEAHRIAALREGWMLSAASCSERGQLQIQRVDDPAALTEDFTVPQLKGDSEAWQLVRNGREEHHHTAKALLGRFNPVELSMVMAKEGGANHSLAAQAAAGQ